MAFESLALAAFAYQFDRLAPYRAMCERAGKSPSSVTSWRDVPMIPAAAFATLELATELPDAPLRLAPIHDRRHVGIGQLQRGQRPFHHRGA